MARTSTADAIRPIVIRGIDVAAGDQARSVEAEHLLLAVLDDGRLPGARALGDAGFPAAWWRTALLEERNATLATAGIAGIDDARLEASPSGKLPGWGASARAALKRGSLHAVERGHSHRMDDVDLLLGIFDASMGTVPRVLARHEVDAGYLAAKLRAA